MVVADSVALDDCGVGVHIAPAVALIPDDLAAGGTFVGLALFEARLLCITIQAIYTVDYYHASVDVVVLSINAEALLAWALIGRCRSGCMGTNLLNGSWGR